MNKKMMLVILAVVASVTMFAQEGGGRGGWGGGQRKTVEERVAMVHQKFDSTFHFATDKQAKIDSAFATQYRTQDSLMQEARAANQGGGRPDPAAMEAIRDKMQELGAARDEKLQTIMTEEEYKKWKSELEPAIRPKRGAGMGMGRRDQGNPPKEEGKN